MTRHLLSYAFPFMDSLDPLAPASGSASRDTTLQMDEETFRGFYMRTSGMLWAYLARATNDTAAADDLLQESYYRLLRATATFESDEHRKNYLFRIATNLIRDRFRRPRMKLSGVVFIGYPLIILAAMAPLSITWLGQIGRAHV